MTTDETEACFIVKDRNGQALAYVYFEDERASAAPRSRITITAKPPRNDAMRGAFG